MKVTLPSGRRVEIVERVKPAARRRASHAPLFAELKDAIDGGDVALRDAELGALSLGDFHALRAILTNRGFLAEDPVDFPCRNCEAAVTCDPCAAMALGPFVDGELDDPELDVTLPFGEPHPIPAVRLVGGARATTVTLEARTFAEAAPLHSALARKRLDVTPAVVRAMGIAALGDERRPDRIARALSTCTDRAWAAIGDAFLRAHYPPRLFAVVVCSACGARNDVDAPYEREMEPLDDEPRGDTEARSNTEPFPTFDAFDRVAHAHATRVFAGRGAEGIALVVDDGVPACDDGGEPLLGCYVPGAPGDPTSPSRAPTISVFFRTFRAMNADEGPYDWRAELADTIDHELDHHFADLAGEDPVDDEERAEIAREAARVHGKKALARRAMGDLGRDIATFLAKTWPIWLLIALLTVLGVLADVR